MRRKTKPVMLIRVVKCDPLDIAHTKVSIRRMLVRVRQLRQVKETIGR